jgi:hypothetical protein
MDATTMHSTNWLIKQLRNDFPQFNLEVSDIFLWSPVKRTVYIDPNASYGQEYSLHELSHALLGHQGYESDIELIKLERDAWEYAKTELAGKYSVDLDEDIIQNNLETYREWLHSRSKCPDCLTTGLQAKSRQYRCIACGHKWRVNEARVCALRRYAVPTK